MTPFKNLTGGSFREQKTDYAHPKVEYWHKSKRIPVISCNKYDEEERKSIFGDKAIPEPFSGFLDEL